MNCQQARRHWDLYYDSEGAAELHFQLNEHLSSCAGCADWFDKQSRLESLIEQRLGSEAVSEPSAMVDRQPGRGHGCFSVPPFWRWPQVC
jgi:predicted anti-sigma-YlaC factor YlaD